MKRFICVQILIVVLLAVTLVGSTFAWSNRPNVNGGFLQMPFTFTYSASINGNACTGKTYLGVVDDEGKLTYDDDGNAVYSDTELQSDYKVTVTTGQVLYLRTKVSNAAVVKTNVSLIAHIPLYNASAETPVNNGFNGNFNIGVSSPTNSVIAYPDEAFIPVVSQYEIIGNASADNTFIDWYIEFNASGEFTLSNVYLANN